VIQIAKYPHVHLIYYYVVDFKCFTAFISLNECVLMHMQHWKCTEIVPSILQKCPSFSCRLFLVCRPYFLPWSTGQPVIHACLNITENWIVGKMWSTNLSLVVYVSTHGVETVKNFGMFSCLDSVEVKHSTAVRKVPGLNPGFGKFCLFVFFFFFPPKYCDENGLVEFNH